MKIRWYKNFLGIVTLLVLGILGLAYDNSVVTAQQNTDKIEAFLFDQFSAQGTADFIVRFTDQADLSLAYSMSWQERGNFVVDQLTETAQRSQINALGILDLQGFRYQTFIAGNELYVFGGNLDTANTLAALPEVSYIRASRTYQIDPIEANIPFDHVSWVGDLLARNALTTVGDIEALEWGINDTKADDFWTTFGVRGEGIIVANIDTGVPLYTSSFVFQLSLWSRTAHRMLARSDPEEVLPLLTIMAMAHIPWEQWLRMMIVWQTRIGMAPNATWIACNGCESNTLFRLCSKYLRRLDPCSWW